jgi:hypothetical protein
MHLVTIWSRGFDIVNYVINLILQFLVAANELGLNKLIKYTQDYLLESKEFIYKDPVSTLQAISNMNHLMF